MFLKIHLVFTSIQTFLAIFAYALLLKASTTSTAFFALFETLCFAFLAINDGVRMYPRLVQEEKEYQASILRRKALRVVVNQRNER